MGIKEILVLNADMQPRNVLPIETIGWHDAVSGVFKGIYSVVHEYDDWVVHSPSITMKVPSVVMQTTYSRPRVHATWKKDNLWLRDRYTCQYCSNGFPASELTKDHVVPRYYGGGSGWDNIVAACHPCNNRRGHNVRIQPMKKPYKPSYYELVEIRKEYPIYVPDESWVPYLAWPEEKIILSSKAN
jgi:5-methylcytosine-specific restriction endonuclease McrA